MAPHAVTPEARAPARPPRPRAAAATAVSGAVLLATAPAEDGGPAALQPWEGGTLLGRLLEQLGALGVHDLHVVTRPGWEAAVRAATGDAAIVLASPDPAGDLRLIAEVAREGEGGLVVLGAEILTQREALAGLLVDPRLATAILVAPGGRAGRFALRVRSRRGRVISAGSPYHGVRSPTGSFLGVLKTAPGDRAALAATADRLAALLTPAPPPEWEEELERKARIWRMTLARAATRGEEERPEDLERVPLSPADEAELRRRLRAAPEDVASLLACGLVRGGAHVGASHLRRLFWARPLSPEALDESAERITQYDEDAVLLESAVKSNDGFFTTFFVSPYSKHIARWCARRGLTPNQVTTVSLAVGVLAALAFATGERWGLVAGAILLQLSFTTDCVDGQLARYSRQFSKLGAWLDSVFDRTKEYAVFAGLAYGASRTGDSVWLLAGAALALQTVRHATDFSYGAAQHSLIGDTRQPPLEQPSDNPRRSAAEPALPEPEPELEERLAVAAAGPDAGAADGPAPSPSRRVLALWHRFDRLPVVVWSKKVIAFPIGERFAVISLTAALFDARVTFTALLAWGAVAAAYALAGRILRSVA